MSAADRVKAFLDQHLSESEKASGKNFEIERNEIPNGLALWSEDLRELVEFYRLFDPSPKPCPKCEEPGAGSSHLHGGMKPGWYCPPKEKTP